MTKMDEEDPIAEGKQGGKDRSRLVSREPRTIALENRRDFIIAPVDGGKRAGESPRHLKVIRSPEGSVNCFSRRELAEGSEDRPRCAADSFE